MILSMAVLVCVVGALFFLPIQVFLFTAVYCYAMLILWRVYTRNSAILDFVVFLIYVTIAGVYWFFGCKDIVPFTGSIFYGALGITSLVGGVAGHPFTLSKISKKQKFEITYHRTMNVIMGVFFMGALYLSIALFPASIYITVPMAISIVAVPVSMVCAKRGVLLFTKRSEVRKIGEPGK